MEYKLFRICEPRQEDIFNDIIFSIACARADGYGLCRLDLIDNDEKNFAKNTRAVARFLRDLKKNDKIQLFLAATDLNGDSTESEYLNNMYPSLEKEQGLSESIGVFFVKL